MEYKIIDMKTHNDKEQKILSDVDAQYNDICKSVGKTRSLKKVMFSNPIKWQETEGDVADLTKTPLTRMTQNEGHGVYSNLNNVVVVCMEGDRIIGFMAGVVNAFDILVNYYESRHLDSYDRVKYGDVYSYLVPDDDTTEPPMSWIEIICVHPEGRGKGISTGLIDAFVKYSKEVHHVDQLVVGLDIVGTLDGGINLGLKEVYEGIGFDFGMPGNQGEVPMMFNGAQFAGKRL